MTPSCQETTDSGFTIIEALVALLILSAVVGMLMVGARDGSHATRSADRHDAAFSLARSLLAMAGITRPLEQGTYSGEDQSGFSWHVTATPVAGVAALQPTDLAVPAAFWVRAEVNWIVEPLASPLAQRTSIYLETVKLAKHR